MPKSRVRTRDATGFTLVEVLVAMLLLAIMAAGIAQLIGISTNATRSTREQTAATILAAAKIEQLRSLAWAYDPAPAGGRVPRTDVSADLSVDPPTDGGPGLSQSPPGTLARSVPPYVDYLDGQGSWVGNGSTIPPNAVFIRRWSVRPLPVDPSRTLVLSVLVTTTAQDRARSGPWTMRSGTEALLVVLHTRKGR